MQRSNLNYFASFVAVSTFFLIVAGAMVTSTGSGLAVPDWPLSFGQFFPPREGGVFFEHGHRMIAGTVGLMTLVLSVWLWMTEERRWLCWLGTAALGAVAIQAVLGGITVLYGLPLPVSAAHATLAQTFFCLTIALAYFTSPAASPASAPAPASAPELSDSRSASRRLFRLSSLSTAFIFIQLVLGSVLRHGGGELFLQSHMIWALMVTGSVAAVFTAAIKNRESAKDALLPALLLILALITQIGLGILAILPLYGQLEFLIDFRTPIVTAHVATGAFLLGASFLTALISRPRAASRTVARTGTLSILQPQRAQP